MISCSYVCIFVCSIYIYTYNTRCLLHTVFRVVAIMSSRSYTILTSRHIHTCRHMYIDRHPSIPSIAILFYNVIFHFIAYIRYV